MDEQPKTTPQIQMAFRASLLMLGALIVYSSILFYLAFQTPTWQLYTHAGGMIVFGLLTALGAVMIRRERLIWGVGLMLTGLYVAGLSATLTVANFGLIMGFILIYLTLAVAGLTLPTKPANWMSGVGIVVGLVNLVLELYVPLPYRLDMPILPAGALVISGILTLIYIGFIIRQFRNYSLRAKLIMAFVLVALVSIGLMTFVINYVIQTKLTQTAGTNLKDAANSRADAISDLISTQLNILSAMSIRKTVIDKVNLSNQTYTGDSDAINAEIDQFDQQWRAASSDNDPLIQSRLNSLLALELRGLRDLAPDHVEIFVTDKYGANVATTNRTSDYSQNDEGWWQAAYNDGQGAFYIGQPEYDQSTGIYVIVLAVPLRDEPAGPTIGVLRSSFRVRALANALNADRFGEAADADILLPSNELLRSEGDIWALDSTTIAQLQAAKEANYAQLLYKNEPRLVSQSPITSQDPAKQAIIANLNWRLIADQNLADALIAVNTTVQTGLITGLGAVLLAGLLAVGLSYVLARPITRLTAVVTQIAAGNLEVQAPVDSTDEIGRLARTFNDMTAQLRGLINTLEDQVRERTSELVLSMRVGQYALTIRELDELLPTIAESIREQFNLYYTQVYFVDDLEKNLILRAGTGSVGQELIARHHMLPIGPGSIVGRVAAERKSIVVSDTQNSAIHKANPLLPETRSELAVPLVFENNIIGVLDMQANKINTFTETNVTVFEAMATQLAISIDSANQWALGQEAQRKSEEVVRQLTREKWTEQLASHRGSLGFAYDLLAVTSLSAADSQATNGEERLAVPLMVQNEPIGQLTVNLPSQRAFSTDERDLLGAVAQHLAQKAENLRLFEQTQQQATREYIARQIVDKVRGSRDVEMALKTAAEELSKALGASRAVIDLRVETQTEPMDSPFEEILSREQKGNE